MTTTTANYVKSFCANKAEKLGQKVFSCYPLLEVIRSVLSDKKNQSKKNGIINDPRDSKAWKR